MTSFKKARSRKPRLLLGVSALFFSSTFGWAASGPSNLVTAQDRIITEADGTRWVQTAHDGQKHPLVTLETEQSAGVLSLVQGTRAYGVCAPRTVTSTSSPDRVMLDEEGWITPVKDQGGRGTCNVFSAIAMLENAYLVEQFKLTSDDYTAKN